MSFELSKDSVVYLKLGLGIYFKVLDEMEKGQEELALMNDILDLILSATTNNGDKQIKLFRNLAIEKQSLFGKKKSSSL